MFRGQGQQHVQRNWGGKRIQRTCKAFNAGGGGGERWLKELHGKLGSHGWTVPWLWKAGVPAPAAPSVSGTEL